MKSPFTPLLLCDLWSGKLELDHGPLLLGCAGARRMMQGKKKRRQKKGVGILESLHESPTFATCLHSTSAGGGGGVSAERQERM